MSSFEIIGGKKLTGEITPQGAKKAFVKLTPEFKASDVAIKLGIL